MRIKNQPLESFVIGKASDLTFANISVEVN